MRRLVLLTLTVLFATSVCKAQKTVNDLRKLRHLDLLFVGAAAPNAITDVTSDAKGLMLDHVGVVIKEDGKTKVIEATYSGVREVDVEQFVQASPSVWVGRVTKKIDEQQTLRHLKNCLGRPYDYVYMPGQAALYCSELVAECFVDKAGSRIFPPVAMSFHDATGQITPYWMDFYSRRGMDVPEGMPGTNPEELSKRECVKIKYVFHDFAK